MARVLAYKIGIAILVLLASWLLWSLAYEIVVALRFAPDRFAGEGADRWALVKVQNADRSADFFLIAWKHFYERLVYPPTRMEALVRAAYAASAVVALGIAGIIFGLLNRRQMPYGSARFGTLMKAARRGLTAKQGIVLGTLNGVTIRSNEPAHILVVGPSRSGKGTGFVLPNGYLWKGSAVFFDPKRENFEALAAHRTAMGNKVFMFSPGSNETHRYNPLDFVRRDERMATDCLVVASFVIPEKADDTWAGAGRLLLSTLIGYVLASPLTAGAQHMRTVARMTTTGKDISSVLRAIVKTEREHLPTWVIDSFNQYIALEPETRNSAVFNVNMAMSLWNNGLISAATEISDFDIRQLRRQPMTIFIGCTIAELSIFRPLIRILLQQIHDLMMVKIPGDDEPHQVLLMLDEFYHVGRMDALISKITISAGYGFRMAIVIQDLAQLDELYGRNTRITTVSGSQMKLFIQINDLETSEFVSEMLGDRTEIYKTPIQRPGQGIFAPRVWAPHYTPRPLRSPLELREMSDRLSILMVKNSPSFQLTKIRHYLDRPYRAYCERSKGAPPGLPGLKPWRDEPLGGAIDPGTNVGRKANKDPVERRQKIDSVESQAPIQGPVRSDQGAVKPVAGAALSAAKRSETSPRAPARTLSLGDSPADLVEENCDVRAILAAAIEAQDDEFAAMRNVLQKTQAPSSAQAEDALNTLHRSFGEEKS